MRALGVSIVDLLDHETVVVSEPALKRLERGARVMKLTVQDIIRQPLVTEKSTRARENRDGVLLQGRRPGEQGPDRGRGLGACSA